jgi:hypothetical protein
MSDSERQPANREEQSESAQAPNLKMLFGLLALALTAAIGFALLIVLPFYRRR